MAFSYLYPVQICNWRSASLTAGRPTASPAFDTRPRPRLRYLVSCPYFHEIFRRFPNSVLLLRCYHGRSAGHHPTRRGSLNTTTSRKCNIHRSHRFLPWCTSRPIDRCYCSSLFIVAGHILHCRRRTVPSTVGAVLDGQSRNLANAKEETHR